MMIGYFDYVVPVGTELSRTATDRRQQRIQDLFAQLDKNADGKVVVEEVPEKYRALFKPLDRDNDDALTVEELSGVISLFPMKNRRP